MASLATININIGVLGHVDSGKTSLCKALSAVASTASFDKSPQSTERGITLDLGFSSATVDVCNGALPIPTDLSTRYTDQGVGRVQFTFVDCPGHASLIRTVMGGAGIVDLMVLVIDAVKGVQTQTAECMVVGEVLGRPLVVVINKCDEVLHTYDSTGTRIPIEGGRAQLDKLRKRLEKMFRTQTRWTNVQFVEVSASPSGPPPAVGEATPSTRLPPENTSNVLVALLQLDRPEMHMSSRQATLDALDKGGVEAEGARQRFFMYVDHCFSVKGQGTVLTGTVASGGMDIGGGVSLPDFQVNKKVKSIQMFRKPATRCVVGDRCGVCIGAGFDASTLDRGVACSDSVIGSAHLLPFYYTNANVTKATRPVADGPGGLQLRQLVSSSYSGFSRLSSTTTENLPTKEAMSALWSSLPSVVVSCNSFVAAVRKVKFHPLPLPSVGGPRMHITVGHTTAMGTLRYFSCPNPYYPAEGTTSQHHRVASAVDEAAVLSALQNTSDVGVVGGKVPVGFDAEDALLLDDDEINSEDTSTLRPGEPAPLPPRRKLWFAVVNLDSPITLFSDPSHAHTTFLASRLDFDADTTVCRMAVDGHVLAPLQDCRLRPYEPTGAASELTPNQPQDDVIAPTISKDTTTPAHDGDTTATTEAAPKAGLQFVKNNRGSEVVQPREVTRELRKKVVGSKGAVDAVHDAVPVHPIPMDATIKGPYPLPIAWLGPESPMWKCPQAARLATGILRHNVFVGFYPSPNTPNRLFHWRSIPALRHKIKQLSVSSIVDDFTCVASLPPKDVKGGGDKAVYGDATEYVGLSVYTDMGAFKKKQLARDQAIAADAVHRSTGSVASTFGSDNRQLRIVFKEPIFQKKGLEIKPVEGPTSRLAVPTGMQLSMVKLVYAPYGAPRIIQMQ